MPASSLPGSSSGPGPDDEPEAKRPKRRAGRAIVSAKEARLDVAEYAPHAIDDAAPLLPVPELNGKLLMGPKCPPAPLHGLAEADLHGWWPRMRTDDPNARGLPNGTLLLVASSPLLDGCVR